MIYRGANVGSVYPCLFQLKIFVVNRGLVSPRVSYEAAMLDNHILSIAIVSRSDTFADDPDYSLASYQKAAYRQYG